MKPGPSRNVQSWIAYQSANRVTSAAGRESHRMRLQNATGKAVGGAPRCERVHDADRRVVSVEAGIADVEDSVRYDRFTERLGVPCSRLVEERSAPLRGSRASLDAGPVEGEQVRDRGADDDAIPRRARTEPGAIQGREWTRRCVGECVPSVRPRRREPPYLASQPGGDRRSGSGRSPDHGCDPSSPRSSPPTSRAERSARCACSRRTALPSPPTPQRVPGHLPRPRATRTQARTESAHRSAAGGELPERELLRALLPSHQRTARPGPRTIRPDPTRHCGWWLRVARRRWV